MVRKTYTPEQIINKLREAEVHISQGGPIAEASRKIGITQQTSIAGVKSTAAYELSRQRGLKS